MPKEDNDNFSFSLKEIERAFTLADFGNVFFLLLVLVMFLPPDYAKYFPKLCSLPVIFLLCPLQYYIVHLYRKEKRKSLLLPGIFLQFFILGITLFLEDSTYQLVFIAYFLIQALAYYYFIRYGKDFSQRSDMGLTIWRKQRTSPPPFHIREKKFPIPFASIGLKPSACV